MAAKFDHASQAASNVGVATLSWTHTIGNLGSTGLVVVCAGCENTTGGNNPTISGVTFNGVSMTQVNTGLRNDGHSTRASMFELHGTALPSAGSYTITVTYSGSGINTATAGAMSFTNVKNKANEANIVATQNGSSTISTSLTTLTKNALVVAAYSSQNTPNATATTGETRAFNAVPGSNEQMETDGFYKTVTTPASTTTTLSTSNPETEVLILASFETIVPGGIIGYDI